MTKSRPWPVIGRTVFFTSDKNRPTNQKPAITHRDEIYFIDFWRENLSVYRINDVLSAKDMCTALSERPVRGTTACVCMVNETHKTLEVNKVGGFSRYHNFKFELNGIRVWRAYGVGKGRVIPYQDIIVNPQGPTDLVVDVEFFSVKDVRIHKTKSSDDEQSSSLFFCSEPGCQMVFKKFSGLESHLDVGEHRQVRRASETVYDKLRRDWAEKFLLTRKPAAH